jgi:hypothetical protein
LLCLAIVVASLVRSRRKRLASPELAVSANSELASAPPELSSPTTQRRLDRRPSVIVTGVVLSGLLGLVAGGPIAGIVTGAAVLVALLFSRGRAVIALGAVLVIVLGAGEVVRHEHVNMYLPGAGWPLHFTTASTIVLVAVTLLGADACLEMARRMRARKSAAADSQ